MGKIFVLSVTDHEEYILSKNYGDYCSRARI